MSVACATGLGSAAPTVPPRLHRRRAYLHKLPPASPRVADLVVRAEDRDVLRVFIGVGEVQHDDVAPEPAVSVDAVCDFCGDVEDDCARALHVWLKVVAVP